MRGTLVWHFSMWSKGALSVSACVISACKERVKLLIAHRDALDQLREERDEALALLQRVEASRNDLARQQGQYKGRIAKVTNLPEVFASLPELDRRKALQSYNFCAYVECCTTCILSRR